MKSAMHFLIAFALILRVYFFLSGDSWIRPYVLMPACLDAFGLGGLLAYFVYYNKEKPLHFFGKPMSLFLGLLIYMLTVIWSKQVATGNNHNYVTIIFLRLSEAYFSLSILAYLISHDQSKSLLNRIFEWSPFVYIGQISYGIYIYHNFVYNDYHSSPNNPFLKVANLINEQFGFAFLGQSIKIMFLYIIVLIIASVSWYIIEKPINKLKNKYGY